MIEPRSGGAHSQGRQPGVSPWIRCPHVRKPRSGDSSFSHKSILSGVAPPNGRYFAGQRQAMAAVPTRPFAHILLPMLLAFGCLPWPCFR